MLKKKPNVLAKDHIRVEFVCQACPLVCTLEQYFKIINFNRLKSIKQFKQKCLDAMQLAA